METKTIPVPPEGLILTDKAGKKYRIVSSNTQNGLVILSENNNTLQIMPVTEGFWIIDLGYSMNADQIFFGK